MGGFPEAGKHQGSREVCQEMAALVGEADEAWALPEQWRPPPHLSKAAWGVQETRSAANRAGKQDVAG